MNEEDEAFEELSRKQGYWGLQGSRKHQILRYAENVESKGTSMTQDEAFKAWWYTEGSQPPFKHHDCEEHTMRMCEIAWANGAFKEREACAKWLEDEKNAPYWAERIRARGQA